MLRSKYTMIRDTPSTYPNEVRSGELAAIISYPTSASGISELFY